MIQTLSQETTLAKVDPTGSGVLCSSRTHWAFLVKSILTSHTRCPITFSHPLGALSHSSNTLNTMPTLFISLARASIHRVLLLFLSNSFACSTLVRISIPYLCVVLQTLVLAAAIIAFLFLRVNGTHQQKAD